jgi:CubicO group peptidase (beta-lactamase class C family)
VTDRGILLDEAAAAGVDPDGLRQAFGLLEEWIGEGMPAGVAALVARGGRIAGEAYLGLADRRRGRPVDAATIWSLASITKPVTATAFMLLVERGQLDLDTPLYRWLPEFLDAPATAFDRRAVTPRHLLAHCAGLPGFSPDNLVLRQAHQPLTAFVRSFGRQPLLFAPGSAHLYSNPGILLAAEAVGRALAGTLGQPVAAPAIDHFHPFVREQILAPLGMTSSALRPPATWDDRIAWVEETGQEGQDWEAANSTYYRGLGIPWGGLFSRPRELVRFVDCFLPAAAGRQRIGQPAGAGDGHRLVSPTTAAAMTAVQFAPADVDPALVPEPRDSLPPKRRPRVAWGIGWEIKDHKRPFFAGRRTSPATFGHIGATGTMAWADPRADVVCLLLTNCALDSRWWRRRPRMSLFSDAVMAAVW